MNEMTIYNAMICRYNEIATKGDNRIFFERLLVRSIKENLKEVGELNAVREKGRIFVFKESRACFTEADLDIMKKEIGKISGLVSMSPGIHLTSSDLPAVEEAILHHFPVLYQRCLQQYKEVPEKLTFRLRVNRAYKQFPMQSSDFERYISAKILPQYERLKVNLKVADLSIGIDIRTPQSTFIFSETYKAPGGLPGQSAGRLMCLLSGGIDSPVAAYRMMMRGCSLDYVTFHSAPYTPPGLLRKVADIARHLNRFQIVCPGRLYAVNMLDVQKQFRDCCDHKYLTILYRRFMMRMASLLARRRKAFGLVTGENVGQVASQTLPNMSVIDRITQQLILRPLIAADKQETMDLAKKIDTYELSIEPFPDSCSVFLPSHPTTACTLEAIEEQEAKIDMVAAIRKAWAEAEEIDLTTYETRLVRGRSALVDECFEQGF